MSEAANKLMLATLAAMAVAPNYLFVTAADPAVKELVDAKFGEMGNPNPDNKKEVQFRLTDAGKVEAEKLAKPTEAAKPTFAIVDFSLPKIERKGGGGKRTSKYPTDKLGPGQAFFIPTTPDIKSPSKTYGSIASAANKKYGDLSAEKSGEFRFFETRTLADGAAFGPQYAGKPGIAVGRLSVAEAAKKRDELIAKKAAAAAAK